MSGRSRRQTSGAALALLAEAFSGATQRAAAGIKDLGQILLAKVTNPDGGDLVEHDGDQDLWVHYEDALTEFPGQAKLFSPLNVLFAQPHADDAALVVRAGDTGGPGAAVMLYGLNGDPDRVPPWLYDDPPKDGLFTPRDLVLESKSEGVTLKVSAADKTVTIQAGTTTVTVTKDGSVSIDAGSNNVTIDGGSVVLKGGSTPVAKEGSATSGHSHSLTGSAGPYPLSGTAVLTTDSIASGAGSSNVQVP